MREMEGNLLEEIQKYHSHIVINYPQDAKDFVIPTKNEMDALFNLGVNMENNDLEKAQEIINDNNFPFEIIRYSDTSNNEHYRMLREKYDYGREDIDHRGWGIFVWNEAPQYAWIMQATHPVFDEETPIIACSIFQKGAHALFMSGTHRYSYPSADDQEDVDYSDRVARSDPSGTEFIPMHAFQLALDLRSKVFIQVHGFTKQKKEREYYPAVVVSDGLPASVGSLRIKQLARELNIGGLRAGLYHFNDKFKELTAYGDLGAETNQSGNWTNALLGESGHFVHLETEREFRKYAPKFTTEVFIRALQRVFPDVDTFLDPAKNLVKGTKMNEGSDVVKDFSSVIDISDGSEYDFKVDKTEEAQMLKLDNVTGDSKIMIEQVISIDEITTYQATVKAKNWDSVGIATAVFTLIWEDDEGNGLSTGKLIHKGLDWRQLVLKTKPPSQAKQARIILSTVGSNQNYGTSWFKVCRLYKFEDTHISRPINARFHDGNPNKVDVHFSFALESAYEPKNWESDTKILNTKLKNNGFTVELDVEGVKRGKIHYFALKNARDIYGYKVKTTRVIESGISKDDIFSGENQPTSLIRKNLEMYPIPDVWDSLNTSGANIIKTLSNHPQVSQQNYGSILGFKKRSNVYIFTHYEREIPRANEIWFRAQILIPKWHEQESRSLYLARVSDSKDNLDDGIRLNLTQDRGGRLYYQLRDENGSGSDRVKKTRAKIGEWQTVEFVTRKGNNVEHELWLDGKKAIARGLTVKTSLSHVMAGTTYASKPEDEKIEFYMKGIRISKTRFGMDSNYNLIFKPVLETELMEIDHRGFWTKLMHKKDIKNFKVIVPTNLNEKDIKIVGLMEDEDGEKVETVESGYTKEGKGTVTLKFKNGMKAKNTLKLWAVDTDGSVGEENSYFYADVSYDRERKEFANIPVTITEGEEII